MSGDGEGGSKGISADRSPAGGGSPDSHAATTARSRSWESVLTSEQFRQIFKVLEAVQDASGGQRFKETLTEAIGEVFGVWGVTFFFGSTYSQMFLDPDPLMIGGIPQPILRDYQNRWYDKDVFALPAARRLLVQHGFATLEDLSFLPAPQQAFVRGFLSPAGIDSASAIHLPCVDGEAIIGIFDRQRRLSAQDAVAMQLLAKHLQVGSRSLKLGRATEIQDVSTLLSPRQREVSQLISDGFTNAAIAKKLNVTEMTVKKYVSRIFEATGVSNRSMLAVAMLRSRL